MAILHRRTFAVTLVPFPSHEGGNARTRFLCIPSDFHMHIVLKKKRTLLCI